MFAKIDIPVKINGVLYPSCSQVVHGLCHEAILGQVFLQAYGAVIDFKNKRLELEATPLHVKEISRATHDCIIPAYPFRLRKNPRLSTSQASQPSKKSTMIKNAMKPQLKVSFMFERITSHSPVLCFTSSQFTSSATKGSKGPRHALLPSICRERIVAIP